MDAKPAPGVISKWRTAIQKRPLLLGGGAPQVICIYYGYQVLKS